MRRDAADVNSRWEQGMFTHDPRFAGGCTHHPDCVVRLTGDEANGQVRMPGDGSWTRPARKSHGVHLAARLFDQSEAVMAKVGHPQGPISKADPMCAGPRQGRHNRGATGSDCAVGSEWQLAHAAAVV